MPNGTHDFHSTEVFEIDFSKFTTHEEFVDIFKTVDVAAFVIGHSALSTAKAEAWSEFDSHAQTLTTAVTEDFVGSQSISESVAATNGFFTIDSLIA